MNETTSTGTAGTNHYEVWAINKGPFAFALIGSILVPALTGVSLLSKHYGLMVFIFCWALGFGMPIFFSQYIARWTGRKMNLDISPDNIRITELDKKGEPVTQDDVPVCDLSLVSLSSPGRTYGESFMLSTKSLGTYNYVLEIGKAAKGQMDFEGALTTVITNYNRGVSKGERIQWSLDLRDRYWKMKLLKQIEPLPGE